MQTLQELSLIDTYTNFTPIILDNNFLISVKTINGDTM